MKTIILYCNRNVGVASLCYLRAKGYKIKVITDEDKNVQWMAEILKCPEINIEHIPYHPHNLFICIHGRKIIPKELLHNKMINIHPTEYNGHNPVSKYIENGDTVSLLRAMRMTEKVDEGEGIDSVVFVTGCIKTYAEYYNIALIHYYRILESILKIYL